jgi:hypothetical protein
MIILDSFDTGAEPERVEGALVPRRSYKVNNAKMAEEKIRLAACQFDFINNY